MIAKVTSKWIDGDLVFYNLAGTEIARFDESAGALDITAAAIGGTALTSTAAEINKLHGAGTIVASGTQAALIADLADAATGAQIATAVNAIIDALQAFKVVATT